MNRLVLIVWAALVSGLFVAESASAAMVPIANASFELPAVSSPPYTYYIPFWSINGMAGVWNPDVLWRPLPDGNQVGWIGDGVGNMGSISQTLTTSLQPNTTYTLSIDVGGRSDGYNPGTHYSVSLLVGSSVLASVTPVPPPAFQWTTLTATYTTGASVSSQPLGIAISVLTGQGTLDVDNVRLSAVPVPEPSTIIVGLLLCIPLGLSGIRCLRNRNKLP